MTFCVIEQHELKFNFESFVGLWTRRLMKLWSSPIPSPTSTQDIVEVFAVWDKTGSILETITLVYTKGGHPQF
jgi:hypothetical protein